tara:strand:- start:1881 stop:2258 length:378 start_codon:yes stop_codon:yes gene_type:complete
MTASVYFDAEQQHVTVLSGDVVTRDSMGQTGQAIIANLAQHECGRLLIDMRHARMDLAVEETTIFVDRLMNGVQCNLAIAVVINDSINDHYEHIASYILASPFELAMFHKLKDANTWLRNLRAAA